MSNQHEKPNTTMETKSNYDHHQELFDSAWSNSQANAIIKWLNSDKGISQILENTAGFKEVFDHDLDVLDCSDGRVRSGAKMGLAGEGILLNEEERQILKAALEKHKEKLGRNILITGHEGCGAAAMAHPGPDSDRYGYENAEKLAEETDNDYRAVDHSQFISLVHNERALVLDATGRFDSANWSEFPPHFISSAAFFKLGDGYLKKEAAALSGIALSDHGLDQRFTAEAPFYVIVSANTEEELSRLSALAKEALAGFGDRVKVDGFVAPEKE